MSAQRYTNSIARDRMAAGTCPECGMLPDDHIDSRAFWLPRECDLVPQGVTDRIAQFKQGA